MQIRMIAIVYAIGIVAPLLTVGDVGAELPQPDYFEPSNDSGDPVSNHVEAEDDEDTFSLDSWGDDAIEPAALQQPPPTRRGPPTRRAPRTPTERRLARSAAFVSAASVPFMIGDTAGGSCFSISLFVIVDLEHPTAACSRLNISENNSPRVQDRVYYSYRHFHNVTETNVGGFANDLDIDRHTLGMEKTLCDGRFSLEARIPVNYELASELDVISDVFNPALSTVPIRDRDSEFGNVSLIGKALLCQRERFLLSGGVGLQLPTADDVVVHGDIIGVGVEGDVFVLIDELFEVMIKNETVNISPFLAWLWIPNDRFFHQGFAQLDVAANPSSSRLQVDGRANPFIIVDDVPMFDAEVPLVLDEETKLHQQTLLRLNFGFGYWLYQQPTARCWRSVAALVELHYTTTLQDAKVFRREFPASAFGEPVPVAASVGNVANRVDVVNLVLGLAAEVGRTTITNGFVMPLSQDDNKAFDFEYNLQVQRRF